MNNASKLGLIIIVASLSTLCGEAVLTFRTPMIFPTAMPSIDVKPNFYAVECTYLENYNYSAVISSGRTVKFMVIPLSQLINQQNNLEERAICSAVIEGLKSVNFKPNRRGIYLLILEALEAETTASRNIYGSRTFPWDFLWDSVTVAIVGALIFLAGLLYDKTYGGGSGR